MIKINDLCKTLYQNDNVRILQSQPDGTSVLEWTGRSRSIPDEYLVLGVVKLRANRSMLDIII